MKITVLGFSRNSGISNQGNQSFDFAQLFVLTPLEPVSTTNYKRVCKGFESPKPLQLDINAIPKFASIDKYPVELELETSVTFSRGENQTLVTGFKG